MENNGDVIHSVGRPCLLNERDANGNFTNDKVILFFQLLASGSTLNIASEASGLDKHTIYSYIEMGNQDLKKGLTTKYTEFSHQLKKKKAECKAKCIIDILKNKDWKAKAWYLERTEKEFRLDNEEEKEEDNKKIIYKGIDDKDGDI